MTADDRATPDQRTEALRGPWVALLTDQYGWPMDPDDLDDESDPVIAVARGSAVPTPPAEQRPGSYLADDLLYERDDFDSAEDLAARWVQAQAVAAALSERSAS